MPDFFLASASECARHIWLSADRGAREAFFPAYVRALHFARGLWPGAVDRGYHALVRLYFEQLEVMRFAEEEAKDKAGEKSVKGQRREGPRRGASEA